MTFDVIVVATSAGTPRLRSMNARTVGPSFSRKKVLKMANVRKKTSDVTPWIPSTTPSSSDSPVWDAPPDSASHASGRR